MLRVNDQLDIPINAVAIKYIASTAPFFHLLSLINVSDGGEEGKRLRYLEGCPSKPFFFFSNRMRLFSNYFFPGQ